MSQHVLLALIGFAFVTSVTPGPNNVMLMASGANFGIRRTLPHMLGVALGFGAMVALLGLGMDRIIAGAPGLAGAMKWVSMGYMLWLAWRIAHAAAPGKAARAARPMGFLAACAFQWVNPKAWMMGLGALSAYSVGAGGALMVAVVFTLVNLPSVAIWVAMGQWLRAILQNPRWLVAFNRAMAVLLVVSMLPVI
ncbi:Threonine/homoserine/homoserine lactone efflux protein [Paracoccus halophilus]|uniref:Membrane protein n=1 Tax=Paracoccus halophilus TaxID=376733 RepID=A0A099F306_9RHOB|nr:LysE family translocator [Paracoccus halophilus]KGJ05030.1 membrane protein [Paracoccus halophilus]SFA39875.1 Threonine/homoserine/homoserine lactone efflux protein [Paracoccus halophilus]